MAAGVSRRILTRSFSGCLARLPKSGDVWPEADRKLWLELLSGSFKLIYKDKNREVDWNKPENDPK